MSSKTDSSHDKTTSTKASSKTKASSSAKASSTKPPSSEAASKVIKTRFYMPDEDKYQFKRVEIKPSTIEKAGRGAFAVDLIPKDSSAMYRGVRRPVNSKKLDCLYSWEIYEYDKKGHTKNDKVICYVDCSKEETGNWTRFANCGPTESANNLTPRQYKNNIYYVATRDIQPGEELFIDYGSGYRETHLGIEYGDKDDS